MLSWILASLAAGSACAFSVRSSRSASLPNCVLELRWALAMPALSVASSLPSCATLVCSARVASAAAGDGDESRSKPEVAAAPAMAPSATANAIAAASGAWPAGASARPAPAQDRRAVGAVGRQRRLCAPDLSRIDDRRSIGAAAFGPSIISGPASDACISLSLPLAMAFDPGWWIYQPVTAICLPSR